MTEILIKLVPILLILLLGYILKRAKVFSLNDGDVILRVVFYISLPALVLTSISRLELGIETVFLPIICVSIILISFLILLLLKRMIGLPPMSWAVMVIGVLIMNNGFLIPFVYAAFGDEGVANLLIFDFMNGFLAFTFVYYHAVKYNPKSQGKSAMFKRFLASPPIYAIMIALSVNFFQIEIPSLVINFLDVLGKMTIPLILLALGIFFSPKVVRLKAILIAIIVRSGVGLLLGLLFVNLFSLQGLEHDIVIIASAAPVGFNTITFSSLENLDKKYAASLVSLSLLFGIIYVPVILYFL